MRIAYYAPLKAPQDSTPSGDRLIARMLMAALAAGGHEVEIACRLRSLDIAGQSERQQRLERLGRRCAEVVLRRVQRSGRRPDLWFTYHLYHKAPDWLGPIVSRALAIPYVVAEASHAPRHEQGPWARGHRSVADALAHADLVIGLNPRDAACVQPLLKETAQHVTLRPFIDGALFRAARGAWPRHRASLAASFSIDAGAPWLIAVGMMRDDDKKLPSYRLLATALASIRHLRWMLLIVGDGPARAQVAEEMQKLGRRVLFLGRLEGERLAEALAASDIFVWPAVNEPIGMVFLEAQAAGLPVVASRRPGVQAVVADKRTGLLVPERNPPAFAAAVQRLLTDSAARVQMARAAAADALANHDLLTQGPKLVALVEDLVA